MFSLGNNSKIVWYNRTKNFGELKFFLLQTYDNVKLIFEWLTKSQISVNVVSGKLKI